ncbi:RNA methyltransferase, TrmA family [Syntrophobotulus glycolicus DSM 8271]|uniref:RNA methyltransferase, TrmA family n=1 Tax=Syntrophobotulus glycolicus (strain DSM 8271 / FlGlyR) TaxID=645991 RepID=F0T0M8_SYNGF|nr:class I SAM-dependent RNA methyltransferase [Syntrophobotulus glycolicus]ADY55093.1 RNA methyltransferase, TrmA family [Syntrophobotulus glycolicus DSM 8271]
MSKKTEPERKTEEVEIVRLSSEGAGVGQIRGKTVFVPGMLPGEKGTVTVTEEKKTYLRGRLVKLERISPARRLPSCAVFEQCGGCSVQHLSYEDTLQWKQSVVRDALLRIGRLEVEVRPVIGMEDPWEYRNKAVLHCDRRGRLGYYAKNSNDLVEFPHCKLLPQTMNAKIKALRQVLGAGKYDVQEVVFRENSRQETLICLKGKMTGEEADRLSRAIRPSFQAAADIRGEWQADTGLPDEKCSIIIQQGDREMPGQGRPSLKGDQGVPSFGLPFLKENINGLMFKVSYNAFQQVNLRQTEVLYNTVLQMAGRSQGQADKDKSNQETPSGVEGTEQSSKTADKEIADDKVDDHTVVRKRIKQVWDLYCGIGTITLLLAGMAENVTGMEENSLAIADAAQNAAENKISNVKFIEGRVEDRIGEQKDRPDLVVVDPPRAGMNKRVIAALLDRKPQSIIYVSCDPATMARDVGMLANGMEIPEGKGAGLKRLKGAYRVVEVQPVDMFGWTESVECVVKLERR